MTDLFCDDDFELDGAGYLRTATTVESVRQEIGRLAEEAGWVAAPVAPALAADIQARTLALLREHPGVSAPEAVSVVQESGGETYIRAAFDGQLAEVNL
jgi:hypothetical protein